MIANAKLKLVSRSYSKFIYGRAWVVWIGAMVVVGLISPGHWVCIIVPVGFVAVAVDYALRTLVAIRDRSSGEAVVRGAFTLFFLALAFAVTWGGMAIFTHGHQ